MQEGPRLEVMSGIGMGGQEEGVLERHGSLLEGRLGGPRRVVGAVAPGAETPSRLLKWGVLRDWSQ